MTMPRKRMIDPFVQALSEQSDWRTMTDPLALAFAKAMGLEQLALGDNFERRECFEVAAALRRSLPSLSFEQLVEGFTVITEQAERGIYPTPRTAFWQVVSYLRGVGSHEQDPMQNRLLSAWQEMNPNARRAEELHGSSGVFSDNEI